MQEILIENIKTDGTQSRVAINKEYVAELVEILKSGKKLPPIEVYKNDDGIWIADGFHRFWAHNHLGKRTIKAEMHKGGEKEAAWHSCGANITHGLRRTNADKRRAVEMALEQKPQASDQLIADHVGVSHATVAMMRKQVQPANLAGSPRTGADGKTRRLPLPPPPPQRVTQKTEAEKPKIRPPPPPGRPEPVKDEAGHPIPDHLQDLFARGKDIAELLRMLSVIRGQVKSGADDPLWAECNRQMAEAGLAQAYDAIKATTPYAVCPWCHGQAPMQKGCKGCAGRGLLGQFRWDTAVPRELKK